MLARRWKKGGIVVPSDSFSEILMGEQRNLASSVWSAKRKITRRERFLAEMDAVIPWTDLVALITPHYPTAGRGRPPMPLETMLRIYLLQHWCELSDPAAEDALYDSEAMRQVARVELGDDAVPDETTILPFRHLLEEHQLPAAIFAQVRALLEAKGLLLKSGTIVDATIINAPSSTKNATGTHDPEMRQTRKGNTWYFGMKIHVGSDRRGLVHSLTTTHAAEADVSQWPFLLNGEETVLYGDRAYWSEADRQMCEAVGIRYWVPRRGTSTQPLSERWRAINQARSRIRACDEHSFHVVKRLWGFTKVRYRGLAKNTARALTAFARANFYMARHRLRRA